ncbi:hypothetical protein Tco_1030161 [Tanacetum coccineum]|uniref:Uncharacterized protein n=1 Tax=Tanacetum coccineum TaxID=301880 RepID=A0ABQ5G6V6_9ASTR
MSHIDCIHPDGDEGDGGCVSGDSFAFQESGDMRELPLSGVEAVTFGGNVSAHLSNENHQVLDNDEDYRGPVSRDRGNVSMHLLTETNDVLDTRTVPLSRVFERFRNLGFNAFDRQTTDDREIQTPTAGATGVGSHVGSPSAIPPANHNVSMRLSTETHDVLDTTTVPLSRVFDRFRNLGFNAFDWQTTEDREMQTATAGAAGCYINAFDRQTTDDREMQTATAGAAGVGSHVGSPSAIAPVNHAYLCLNVTNCIIRPAIIPFVNSRLENAYQTHARGDNSATIDFMSPDNEGIVF